MATEERELRHGAHLFNKQLVARSDFEGREAALVYSACFFLCASRAAAPALASRYQSQISPRPFVAFA